MLLVNDELPQVYVNLLPRIFQTRSQEYKENQEYARGENPKISKQPEKPAPDNRVPVPFGRKIVATLQGYCAKVGYISYSSNGEYASDLKSQVLDPNDEEILTSELFDDALTAGYAYEVIRMDEDLQPRIYRIPGDKGLMVFDDTLAKNPIAFVNIDRKQVVNEQNQTITYREIMTIYYDSFFVDYEGIGIGTIGTGWREINRQKHPFGKVPAIEYITNKDKIPVFEAVKSLIDEHDKIISSDYANEMERFANAYLLIAKHIDDGDIDDIKSKRIFQDLKQMGEAGSVADQVAFLTKPSRGSDIAEAADRFERLIYDMVMVINPADKNFGGASGIALSYKVLPMEWLAASIMAYFTKGLQRRFELLGNAMITLNRLTPEDVTIHERRNLPLDLLSIAQIANQLLGVLSLPTVLNLFPADIVPDKALELMQIANERDPLLIGLDSDDTTELQ